MEDPLFYFDHDLPTDSAEHFFQEFSRRTGKKCIFCDLNKKEESVQSEDETDACWRIYYLDSLENCLFKNENCISAYYEDEHLNIEIDFFLHSYLVYDFEIDKNDFDTRWSYLWNYFIDLPFQRGIWFERLQNCWESYLIPFFHSKYLNIIPDSFDDEFLETGGKIEDKINSEEKGLVRNEDIFKEENYCHSPIIFDLDFVKKMTSCTYSNYY